MSHGHYMRASDWWSRNDALGEMDIKIVGANGDEAVEVSFDGAEAAPGWNSLGVYQLPAGSVDVRVSDRTTGDIVVADAIRWQRAEASAQSSVGARRMAIH